MTSELRIPPLRELPPERLQQRKDHLLSEIARARPATMAAGLAGLSSLAARPRVRLGVVVGLAASAAVATSVVIDLGSRPSAEKRADRASFVIRALSYSDSSPGWGVAAVESCPRTAEIIFGCGGIISPTTWSTRRAPVTRPGEVEARDAPTLITGGTEAQRALLSAIVERMRPTSIRRIEISALGDDAISLEMSATGQSEVRTEWEELLIAAAFRDRARMEGNATKVSLETPDQSGLIPPGPPEMLAVGRSEEPTALSAIVREAAEKTGASLEEFTIRHPYGPALAATLEVSDPASYLLHHMQAFLEALGDRRNDYDGLYLRLLDRGGSVVWEISHANRTATGALRAQAEIAGCSPVVHFGGGDPPCPAQPDY